MSRPTRESLRDRILRRDRYHCVYCGERFPAEALTLDHVQPKLRGGDQSEGNLVAACRSCNTEKGSQPAWSYLADRPEKRANFLRLGRAVWSRHRRAILQAVRTDGSGSGSSGS